MKLVTDLSTASLPWRSRNVLPPPALMLDFAAGLYVPGAFSDLVAFTRSSAASYFDADGVLQGVAADVPRFDHEPATGAPLGLLVEESRTNDLTYSDDFTNAVWLTGGLSSVVTADTGVSPDGTANADTLSVDVLGGTSTIVGMAANISVSTSTTYTASVFAKADQSDFIAIGTVSLTTPVNGFVWFDLVNGTVGASDTGYTGAIQDCGNGWYRCSVTFTTDAADTSGQLRIYLGNADGGSSMTRDGTSSVLIYGAQLEAGAFATSYIPTAGGTVTRAADLPKVAAAAMPYSPVGMSFALEGAMTYADSGSISEVEFFNWYLDSSNYTSARLRTDGAKQGQVDIRQAETVSPTSISAGGDYVPGALVPFNIASRHGQSFIQGASNGVAFSQDSTPTAFADLSATDFDLAANFNGHLKRFRVWGEAISTAMIEAATA